MATDYDTVPLVYPLHDTKARRGWTNFFAQFHDRVGHCDVYGDSQEGGSGLDYINQFAACLCMHYGGVTATTFSPMVSTGGFPAAPFCISGANVETTSGIFGLTVDASTGTTLTDAALAGTEGLYIGWFVQLTSAPRDVRRVTAYNHSTKVLTVDSAWTTNPTAGTFYNLNPVSASRLPYSAASSITGTSYGPIWTLQPDAFNAQVVGISGYLPDAPNNQHFLLPAAPANLTSAHKVRANVIVATRDGSPALEVKGLVGAAPVNNYFDTVSQTWTNAFTADELDDTDSRFILRSFDIPYAASKPYARLTIRCPNLATGQAPAIVGCWFESLTHSHGIAPSFFAAGGYRVRNWLDVHSDLADFCAVKPADFSIIKLGANDAHSTGGQRTAVEFKSDLIAWIGKIREWRGANHRIVIISDTVRSNADSVKEAEYNQFPGVAVEIAQELPLVMAINSMLGCERFLGWSDAQEEDGGSAVPSNWSSATTYAEDALVQHKHTVWKSLSSHSNEQPPNATYWEDLTWASGVAHVAGEQVAFARIGHRLQMYQCLTNHTSSATIFPNASGNWKPVRIALTDLVHLQREAQRDLASMEVALMLGAAECRERWRNNEEYL